MSIVQIRQAQREGARLIIGLGGVSGSGKTFTALQLAYGMTYGDGSKVGFLDTENRRGSLYADPETYRMVQQSLGMEATPSPFLIGDLYAPFSPERYIGAIQDFQASGVEVLVIDSATHEYEGTGGCIEIAEAGNPKMPNWNKAKAAHKRFMNAVLQSNMHIIFCVRAREKATPERVEGKIVYRDLGLQPIQEKNFMFEMTASVMLHEQGYRQDVMKCPAQLQNILGRGEGYLTAADGRAVREWVDGAVQLDPKVEAFRNKLISNTEGGLVHIKDCWSKTPADVRSALGTDFLAGLEASAREYDQMKAEAGSGADTQADTRGQSAATASALAQSAARGRQAQQGQPQTRQQAEPEPEAGEKVPEPEQDSKPVQQTRNTVKATEATAGEDGDVF